MAPEDWQKARLIGEHDDDEQLDSADDEDLDSDAAFDESDEERFAGFFSTKEKPKQKKQKQAVRFADVDLNEDEGPEENGDDEGEEEEEGDPDEFIDLLDVLDGKGEIDMGSDNDKSKIHKNSDNEDEDEGSDSGEEEEDEEQHMFSASDTEEAPEAAEEFQNFISNLDPTSTKKRKRDETELAKSLQSRKRRLLAERTEAGIENEFRAHASGSKLKLDDLLAPLATQSSNLITLKKNTKVLSTSSTKSKPLSAPLPQRAQERLDREAAYEKTKEEVDKWSTTMKRIREAEHLSFPLQARPSGRVSNLELAAKFKPSTKLESSVDALLKSAKMRDEDIEQTEDTMLKSNNLTLDQVAQRRSELRHMRELMFRAELKAKRINKIKSRTYRKLKRKEKDRLKEKIREADGEGESETEEGRLKREIERARERATLKHKHTGKWAKQMRQRHLDEDERQDMSEMLHRGEQLRQKIQGVGSGDESSEGDEDEDEDDDDTEAGIQKIKSVAFDEVKQLAEQVSGTEPSEKGGGRAVFEMKFMKDAMARAQAATDKLADDFVKELGGDISGASDGDNDHDEPQEETDKADPSTGVLASRSGGRMIYRPNAPQNGVRQNTRSMGSLASDTSSVTLKSTDLLSAPTSPQETFRVPAGPLAITTDSPEMLNPWLTRETDSSSKVSRKKNEVFDKNSQRSEKSKNKLKKLTKKGKEEKEKAQEDAIVEISMDNNLTIKNPTSFDSRSHSSSTLVSKSTPGPTAVAKSPHNNDDDSDDSDANSEVEAQEAAILKTKIDANPRGLKAFQQRDLVALAFAGDDVVHEFEETKKREIAADAPKDVDTTIPGWGSWGGQGVRRAPAKPERIKKIAGIDPKSRADHNKKHVIISEKRDKKAARYLVKDLPYPYTSRAQFERSMEQPLGKEWNTRVGFQRGTLPRVLKKPGVIIDPLSKMT